MIGSLSIQEAERPRLVGKGEGCSLTIMIDRRAVLSSDQMSTIRRKLIEI
ncbi:hypothetical protein LEMLEM_LOCUS7244 [Lemmus lemmus]